MKSDFARAVLAAGAIFMGWYLGGMLAGGIAVGYALGSTVGFALLCLAEQAEANASLRALENIKPK